MKYEFIDIYLNKNKGVRCQKKLSLAQKSVIA